ncbi:MAG: caspase family protein [Bacteroidia bacterium]
MSKKLVPFLLFLITSFGYGQSNKRALIVTIGDYPNNIKLNQTWPDLASNNDKELVYKQLVFQGFPKNQIHIISDEEATAAGIKEGLIGLIESSKEGDLVYFHYSGHGQQVSDVDGALIGNELLQLDEIDNFDEALVAYNAPFKSYEGYKLQDHVMDDELNYYFGKLKQKLGSTGQLIVVLDACHSGSGTRGGGFERTRGTGEPCIVQFGSNSQKKISKVNNTGLEMDFKFQESNDLANLVVFSGCKSHEKNHEYYDPRSKKWYGSLSYSMVKSWNELTNTSTYKDWYSKVNQFVSLKYNNVQHPELEGDNIDVSVFNGEIIETDIFYEVDDVNNGRIKLKSGYLLGLNFGDSIAFFPIGTKRIKDTTPLGIGVISEIKNNDAYVTIADSIISEYEKNSKWSLKGYLHSKSPLSKKLHVRLAVKSRKLKRKLTRTLSSNPNIVIANQGAKVLIQDTLLADDFHAVIPRFSFNNYLIQELPYKVIWSDNSYDSLLRILENTLRIELFRQIELASKAYDFKVELKRLTQDRNDTLTVDPSFAKYNVGDFMVFTLTNMGTENLRFHVLDIYPNNIIVEMDPRIANTVFPPGTSKTIFFDGSVEEPFGLEQLKFIATPEKIDFSPVTNLGRSLSKTRGNNRNPLFDYINQSVKTRGGGSRISGQTPSICIKNMYFEILPDSGTF